MISTYFCNIINKIFKINNTQNYFTGIIFALIAITLSAINNIFLKSGTEIFTKTQVLIYKPFYSLIWFLIFHSIKKGNFLLINNAQLMTIRLFFGLLSMGFYLNAISITSIGILTGCMMTYPLILSACSHFFLNEKIKILEILGLILSFIGTTIIISPKVNSINFGALFALAASFFMAMYMLYTKKLTMVGENKQAMLFYYILCLIVAGLINLFIFNNEQSLINNSIKGHLFLFVSGLIYFCFLSTMIKSLSIIKAKTYAFLEYTEIIWAIIFDYIFWHHIVKIKDLLGIFIICSASVLVLLYRNKNEKKIKT